MQNFRLSVDYLRHAYLGTGTAVLERLPGLWEGSECWKEGGSGEGERFEEGGAREGKWSGRTLGPDDVHRASTARKWRLEEERQESTVMTDWQMQMMMVAMMMTMMMIMAMMVMMMMMMPILSLVFRRRHNVRGMRSVIGGEILGRGCTET